VPEITGRSSGEFHQRSASAADPHTNELVLENAHHGAKTTGHAKFLDTIEVQGLYITVLSLTNSISFNLPHNIQTHDSKFKASHNI